MTDVIAVFNAGSSTLKFSVFHVRDLSLLHQDTVEVPGAKDGQRVALQTALDWFASNKDDLRLCAAGHRIVHGKDRAVSVKITPEILAELDIEPDEATFSDYANFVESWLADKPRPTR